MTVTELFRGVPGVRVTGSLDTVVTGISIDSRRVTRGDLFVALRGASSDGRRFIPEALGRGASAVAGDVGPETARVTFASIPDARAVLGTLASRIHGEPSKDLRIVGVTGTNGKTTVTLLVQRMLQACGSGAGAIGTLGYGWHGQWREGARTTPEAPDLQRILREMRDDSVGDVVLECSSHGLAMGRLNALHLDAAVFTNLTPEHLDFHGTLDAYREAKKTLFTGILDKSCKPRRFSILNVDDETGKAWARELEGNIVTFSAEEPGADVSVESASFDLSGIRARVLAAGRTLDLRSPLLGAFNLSNLLAALAVAAALGLPMEQAAEAASSVDGIPGRLERVANGAGIHVFVDYAHTPDALSRVTATLCAHKAGRLIVVFGCGGERDRAKRPEMGRIAASTADVTIVTTDNPRGEDPASIIEDVCRSLPDGVPVIKEEALSPSCSGIVAIVPERGEAIRRALDIARSGDTVLIAGKGHETYQESRGVRTAFDDRAVARQALEGSGP